MRHALSHFREKNMMSKIPERLLSTGTSPSSFLHGFLSSACDVLHRKEPLRKWRRSRRIRIRVLSLLPTVVDNGSTQAIQATVPRSSTTTCIHDEWHLRARELAVKKTVTKIVNVLRWVRATMTFFVSSSGTKATLSFTLDPPPEG